MKHKSNPVTAKELWDAMDEAKGLPVKKFPILLTAEERKDNPHWPREIDWSLVEPHRKTAMQNHGQTLERLAERGGLGMMELYAVLMDIPYSDLVKYNVISDKDAAPLIVLWGIGFKRIRYGENLNEVDGNIVFGNSLF